MWGEVDIMILENLISVRVRNVKFRLVRRNWSIFVNLCVRFEIVNDEFGVCKNHGGGSRQIDCRKALVIRSV